MLRMDEKSRATAEPDIEERLGELREGVISADATGMIASEELPVLPHADLHAALPHGHAHHATIDRLHREITSPSPDRSSIEKHVGTLRGLPEVEAIITNWWDDPKTQRFIANLSQIGL